MLEIIVPATQNELAEKLAREMDDARRKALDALCRSNFQSFGYWAAMWTDLNRISGLKRSSPFKSLLAEARSLRDAKLPPKLACDFGVSRPGLYNPEACGNTRATVQCSRCQRVCCEIHQPGEFLFAVGGPVVCRTCAKLSNGRRNRTVGT